MSVYRSHLPAFSLAEAGRKTMLGCEAGGADLEFALSGLPAMSWRTPRQSPAQLRQLER